MEIHIITIQSNRCMEHESYLISIELPTLGDWHTEMIEGAMDGFINSIDCTVCAANLVDMDVHKYLDIFIEKFLPILNGQVVKANVTNFEISKIKPISYG